MFKNWFVGDFGINLNLKSVDYTQGTTQLATTERRLNKLSTIFLAIIVALVAIAIVGLIAGFLLDTPISSAFFPSLMVVGSIAGAGHGLINSKPRADKYEVLLVVIVLAIVSFFYVNSTAKIFSYTITFISIFVLLALGLILFAYHVDRVNQWKKDQQTPTPSTHPNSF
jgi:hypothetical protein